MAVHYCRSDCDRACITRITINRVFIVHQYVLMATGQHTVAGMIAVPLAQSGQPEMVLLLHGHCSAAADGVAVMACCVLRHIWVSITVNYALGGPTWPLLLTIVPKALLACNLQWQASARFGSCACCLPPFSLAGLLPHNASGGRSCCHVNCCLLPWGIEQLGG